MNKEFVEKLIGEFNKHIKYNESMIEESSNNMSTFRYQNQKNTWESAKDVVEFLARDYISEKCPKRCSGRMLYQCGYKDGQKAGLQQGHDMIEKLLKEQQTKIDKLLAYEGEE